MDATHIEDLKQSRRDGDRKDEEEQEVKEEMEGVQGGRTPLD